MYRDARGEQARTLFSSSKIVRTTVHHGVYRLIIKPYEIWDILDRLLIDFSINGCSRFK